MTEKFTMNESQPGEILGAHLRISPEQLAAVKSRINSELEVLKAQRAFTTAAHILRGLTEFVPKNFDQVVDRIEAEVGLNGRNLAEADVMAVIESEDGTRIVEDDEGFSIEAFNPDKPNRVLFAGFDFSNRGTYEYDEGGKVCGQFWALADLDNLGEKLELHILRDSNIPSEQFTAKLYEQLYSE